MNVVNVMQNALLVMVKRLVTAYHGNINNIIILNY